MTPRIAAAALALAGLGATDGGQPAPSWTAITPGAYYVQMYGAPITFRGSAPPEATETVDELRARVTALEARLADVERRVAATEKRCRR